MKRFSCLPQRALAPHWMTFVSGLLIVLSFPPWNMHFFLWIAFIPWFWVIHQSKTVWLASIQGVWLGYFMTLGCFFWVVFALKEFGNFSWLISIGFFQIFCFFCQPQFFLFSMFSKILIQYQGRSFQFLSLVVLSFLYTGLDWIVPKLFVDTIGHALYAAPYVRQAADLSGVFLLTFLIIWSNWILLDVFMRLKWTYSSVLGFLCLLMIFCYGWRREREINAHLQKGRPIQIAAIQGNIGNIDKLASEEGVSEAITKVITRFTQLTRQALQCSPRPEMIIWPETAYPLAFRKSDQLFEQELDWQLEQLSSDLNVPILFGGYDHLHPKDYNAFFFLDPNGGLQIYHKHILLLFAEYIPGADHFQAIKDFFPQVGNFGRGLGPDMLTVVSRYGKVQDRIIRIAPVICYEVLFANYLRVSAQKGSQIIFNITNDSWFGSWGEPQLHLALASFRSIETRLPLLRATNTGISALITATGEITHRTQINREEILNVSVTVTQPIQTLFKLYGDWFSPSAFLMGWCGFFYLCFSRRRRVTADTP